MNSTIKDVALEAKVSTATVSRVLNNSGFVSNEIKERVQQAVEKLNYQPSAIARGLRQNKTSTIGVVIPDISNQYYMNISKGIEDIVQQRGYNLFFCSSDENSEKEAKLLQMLYEQRVGAIVLATAGGNEANIRKIDEMGVPIVLVDRTAHIPGDELDTVMETNFESAYKLTMKILEKGHNRIGLVNGLLKVSTGRERFAGYKKALEENGIEVDLTYIHNGSFTQEGGEKAVEYFLSLPQKPTAILSLNNNMTLGVLLELTRRGYSLPEDFLVGSYGDLDSIQLLKSSGIITVTQEPYEMGKRVGEILIKRLNQEEGPFIEIIKPKLSIYN